MATELENLYIIFCYP